MLFVTLQYNRSHFGMRAIFDLKLKLFSFFVGYLGVVLPKIDFNNASTAQIRRKIVVFFKAFMQNRCRFVVNVV